MKQLLGVGLAIAVLVLVAVAVQVWPRGEPGETSPPAAPRQLDAGEQRALAAKMAARVDERPRLDADERAPVAAASDRQARAARVRIVDARTRQPVPGARVLDLAGGTLAAAAADGLLHVDDARAGRIAFLADGYLAKLPTAGDDDALLLERAAGTKEVVEVGLRRDEFTLACGLRFSGPDGAAVAGRVRFTLACLDEPPPTAMSFPTGKLPPAARVDPATFEAWRQHVAVQLMPAVGTSLVHLGVQSNGRVFEVEDGGGEVRFVASGRYRVAAVAPGAELAGSREFTVDGGGGPIEVRLAGGRFVHGVAVDASDGRPVAGVTVRLTDPVVAALGEAETGSDGAFRIGPIAADSVAVQATSRRYRDVTATLGVGSDSRLMLTPKPVDVVRGIVRQRATLAPIAGAEVLLRRGFDVDARVQTGADGTFALEAVLEAPELVVRAPGFLAWVEAIREPQDSYPCDLWPAEVEARLQAGLTGVLAGRVVDAKSQPAGGVPVQLLSDEATMPQGIPGRVVLEGLILPLRPMALTEQDGTFVLEWHQAGTFHLLATNGRTTPADATPVTVALGQRTRDLLLHVP